MRGTQGNLRGRMALDVAEIEKERGREAGEGKGSEEEGWRGGPPMFSPRKL